MLEAIVELVAEILLQLFFELLAELGLRSVAEPFRKRPHPALAATSYLIFGLAAGGVSLLFAPHAFGQGSWRLVNLLVAPIVVGLAMAGLGAWRAKRGQDLVRLDRFMYGYLFAVSFAIVRFQFAE